MGKDKLWLADSFKLPKQYLEGCGLNLGMAL